MHSSSVLELNFFSSALKPTFLMLREIPDIANMEFFHLQSLLIDKMVTFLLNFRPASAISLVRSHCRRIRMYLLLLLLLLQSLVLA